MKTINKGNKSIARAIVKAAVMIAMFCENPQCERVLDQRNATSFEFEHGGIKQSRVFCPTCTNKAKPALAVKENPGLVITAHHWAVGSHEWKATA